MSEYRRNPRWTRDFVRALAARLQLTVTQVYKWQWDQIKKHGASGTGPIATPAGSAIFVATGSAGGADHPCDELAEG